MTSVGTLNTCRIFVPDCTRLKGNYYDSASMQYLLNMLHRKFQFVSFYAVFFSEVVDSLTRGYDDKLHPDNLILEINSSRYAYNVSV
jgi:hypothetical protein